MVPDEGPGEQQLPRLTADEEEHRQGMYPLYVKEHDLLLEVSSLSHQVQALERDLEDAKGTLRNQLKHLQSHQNNIRALEAGFKERQTKKGNKAK